MKTLLIALWLALLASKADAQLFKEWFRQNKTQREYLKEQIVQLKLYLELTKQGYKIAKGGLSAIHQIKNGEFILHKNRFDSLRIVKAGISSLTRLRHITDLHGSINQICEKLPEQINSCQALDQSQKKQMLTVLARLYDDCQVVIGGFFLVIRDDQVAMTDDERISRIEDAYQQMEESYLFAQSLRRDLSLLCKAIPQELEDIVNRRMIEGLK